jgi:hypothetical protein
VVSLVSHVLGDPTPLGSTNKNKRCAFESFLYLSFVPNADVARHHLNTPFGKGWSTWFGNILSQASHAIWLIGSFGVIQTATALQTCGTHDLGQGSGRFLGDRLCARPFDWVKA